MTSATPEALLSPGDLVAGKYRIERELARGGMGVVYEARHKALDQRVAVKCLLPGALANREAVERFEREARAAACLQSDYVARVSDVGELPNGIPYMVMEYLDGGDLSAEIETRGPLPIADAVDYVLQALEAIAEAHSFGIVHRDLKPSNLFLTTRPDRSRRVKVLDFGISKVSVREGDAVKASITSTKSMLGSPGYMSPEQVRSSRSVDARTDIWSIGVILYELLSGRMLFDGDTMGEIFAKILELNPSPLSELRADVPIELEAVVARCLERNRDNRFTSATELSDALGPFASTRTRMSLGSLTDQRWIAPISSKRPSLISLSAETIVALAKPPKISELHDPGIGRANPHTDATWMKTGNPTPSRPWIAIAGGGVVLLMAVGFAGWRMASGPSVSASASIAAAPTVIASPNVTVTPAESAPTMVVSPAVSASADPPATIASPKATPPSHAPHSAPRAGKPGLPSALQGRD